MDTSSPHCRGRHGRPGRIRRHPADASRGRRRPQPVVRRPLDAATLNCATTRAGSGVGSPGDRIGDAIALLSDQATRSQGGCDGSQSIGDCRFHLCVRPVGEGPELLQRVCGGQDRRRDGLQGQPCPHPIGMIDVNQARDGPAHRGLRHPGVLTEFSLHVVASHVRQRDDHRPVQPQHRRPRPHLPLTRELMQPGTQLGQFVTVKTWRAPGSPVGRRPSTPAASPTAATG